MLRRRDGRHPRLVHLGQMREEKSGISTAPYDPLVRWMGDWNGPSFLRVRRVYLRFRRLQTSIYGENLN